MILALDYDDTFTNDEGLWRRFVEMAVSRGHSVTFVTSRSAGSGNMDIESDANLLGIPVVYCNGQPKADCFSAHVWIDDSPLMIPSYAALRAASLGEPK